jgi:glycogen operon protein
MLLGGDELGRSQGGNNNAWCQDNEISWFDWEAADGELLAFARRLIALRRAHPAFRRVHFLTGQATESGLPDVWWFRPDGRRMTRRDWEGGLHALGVFLNGAEIAERTPRGEPIRDDSFIVLLSAHHEPLEFLLPARRFGQRWQLELSTVHPELEPGSERWTARQSVALEARSLLVLRRA